MLYSPTCQHALRALIFLARHEDEGPVLARTIAEAEGIPKQFLSKILHGLRIKGIVKSQKGPGGGFELAKPARTTRVTEVIEVIDGAQDLSEVCILGLDKCTAEASCALHDQWSEFRDRYADTVHRLSLADLALTLAAKRS